MSAFLFPGQGSQTPGMGKFLVDNFKTAELCFEEASDALSIDLKQLCFQSSEKDLSLTENTQPALLTVSTATARTLTQDLGLKPEITAGHSVGEYASLVLGQVMSFKDALKAVRLRGQAMQSAVPLGQGGMTATLGLSEEQVDFLCRWATENSGYSPLSAANYNCDGQIVISGHQKALDWAKNHFKPEILPGEARRAKLIPLQVSAPFHCELMKPAEKKMQTFFDQISLHSSSLPIIQNVSAQPETSSDRIKENIVSQVSAPVKWTHSMRKLKELNIAVCFEVGHGSVLRGLLKKIDGDFFRSYGTSNLDEIRAIESLSK